ncbi:hypothetical protein CW731_11200 [Polaribacter sp. ALD11]|uniref:DUF6168 family protein n=1 Tax=Polaribacter sp. ALD11 TaxID=2058137 RepID=UPI000C3030FA|nr:DUF6168 family protein [Polaribacter sp. ALD11]AUC85818.1 hypothetical protein CW731_11200 [Polaribacter sp. ALD11]
MIKRVLSILLVFITLYFIGMYMHTEILENKGITVPFSIKKLYQFHAGFSILVCINLVLLNSVNKLLEQLGFIYLGTMLIKIVLFSATFYQAIIKGENLIMAAKLSLLVPTFIFLLTEVFFVVKILNRKH